jgi:hypothetical protein
MYSRLLSVHQLSDVPNLNAVVYADPVADRRLASTGSRSFSGAVPMILPRPMRRAVKRMAKRVKAQPMPLVLAECC